MELEWMRTANDTNNDAHHNFPTFFGFSPNGNVRCTCDSVTRVTSRFIYFSFLFFFKKKLNRWNLFKFKFNSNQISVKKKKSRDLDVGSRTYIAALESHLADDCFCLNKRLLVCVPHWTNEWNSTWFCRIFRKNCVTGGRRSAAWLVLVAAPRTRRRRRLAQRRADIAHIRNSLTGSFICLRPKKKNFQFFWWSETSSIFVCGEGKKFEKISAGSKHFVERCDSCDSSRLAPHSSAVCCFLGIFSSDLWPPPPGRFGYF